MTPTIGELRALRVQAGLSVWQVGEMVEASGSAVSAWEEGRRRPTREILQRYADAVGWDPEKIHRTSATDGRASWEERAGCHGASVEIFFTVDAAVQERAKRFCRSCPVREECLNWALAWGAAQEGIAGGLTAEERRQYQRNLARRALRARAS